MMNSMTLKRINELEKLKLLKLLFQKFLLLSIGRYQRVILGHLKQAKIRFCEKNLTKQSPRRHFCQVASATGRKMLHCNEGSDRDIVLHLLEGLISDA